ncbi:MAG: SpoVG family protein [Lachnospiraceae bacterium]|nr:SpoVG family protein [Lachnospiraceae bacterium]
MQITEIRMNLVNNESCCKAIGTIALDGAFAVRGMRVMEDHKGRNFVSFPARARSNGEYEDVAYPLNKELYHHISDAFIEEYNRKRQQEMSQGHVDIVKDSKEREGPDPSKEFMVVTKDADKVMELFGEGAGADSKEGISAKADDAAAKKAEEEAAKPKRGRGR